MLDPLPVPSLGHIDVIRIHQFAHVSGPESINLPLFLAKILLKDLVPPRSRYAKGRCARTVQSRTGEVTVRTRTTGWIRRTERITLSATQRTARRHRRSRQIRSRRLTPTSATATACTLSAVTTQRHQNPVELPRNTPSYSRLGSID